MLSKALNQLIPLYESIQEKFSLEKMMKTDDGKIDVEVLKQVATVLKAPHFNEFNEMIRTCGEILEKYAHRCEGCECHRHIWMSKRSFAGKRKALKETTGHETCYMKGRQAAWFQAVGLQELREELMTATSECLQIRLEKTPDGTKVHLVKLKAELAEALVEELMDKFAFYFECPYSAIGLYYGEVNPAANEDVRKKALVNVSEYDAIVRSGKRDKLHRVAHILYAVGTECRRQLLEFADTPNSTLKNFPLAYLLIKRYALIPIVGRRTEAVHSELKRIGALASNMHPPWIAASLREPAHLERLEHDAAFRKFCEDRWRSRTLMDEVLNLVVPKQELAGMTKLAKINCIYQCSIESEFRDMKEERDAHKTWLAATAHTRGSLVVMPDTWKQSIAFLKARLSLVGIHSLPTRLFQQAFNAVDGSLRVDLASVNPWSVAVAVMSSPRIAFDMASVGDVTFFQTINANPERRHNVPLHHISTYNDIVNVCIRTVTDHHVPTRKVKLLSDSRTVAALRVTELARNIDDVLRSLYVWTIDSDGFVETMRHTPLSQPALPSPSLCSSPLVPTASFALAQVGCNAEVHANGGPMGAPPLVITDKDAIASLEQIKRVQQTTGSSVIRFRQLEHITTAVVESLVSRGALQASYDEFGELELSRSASQTRYIATQRIAKPQLVIDAVVFKHGVKLDMIIALLQRHWVIGMPLSEYKLGRDQMFIADGRKPCSYFMCLLSSNALFAKGVPAVPHTWKDCEYQCLLRLHGKSLQDFLSQKASGAADDSWCKKALAGADEKYYKEALTLEDPGEEDIEIPPFNPPIMPALLDADPEWLRCLVSHGGQSVKVIFDHRSSGPRQRGYANCLTHNNCYRGRHCDEFESRLDYAAYMFTWATAINIDRLSHKSLDYEPAECRVAELRSVIEITEF